MKLTVIDQNLEDQIARTPTGMAFWAGTGPEFTSCRECLFFQLNGYYSARGRKKGLLKPGQCKKFVAMTNIDTHKLPYDTKSCKYFEKNPIPPDISDKGRS